MSQNIKRTESNTIQEKMDSTEKGYSNDVFYDKKSNSYFLPARIRLKFKMFKEIKMEDLRAEMDGTLIISIYYGDLPEYLVQQLRQKIVVNFNLDDPFRLKQGYDTSVQVEQKNQQISFYYRGSFHMLITSDVFWSPFELIQLVLTINLLKIIVYKLDKDGKPTFQPQCTIKFNMMDCDDEWSKLSYTSIGKFGDFDLAQKKMMVQYTDNVVPSQVKHDVERAHGSTLSQIAKQGKPKKAPKMRQFQYAHFSLPIYKFPLPTITTIFIPLFLLSFINLCIFWQEHDLANRVASIGAVMVAFVALIPNIRSQIPPSHQITFLEILVIVEAFTSVLCLIHSLLGVTMPPDEFYFYDIFLYQISKWVSVCASVTVVIQFIKHKIRMGQYNDYEMRPKTPPAKRDVWYNIECDQLCRQLADFDLLKWSKVPEEVKEQLLKDHYQEKK